MKKENSKEIQKLSDEQLVKKIQFGLDEYFEELTNRYKKRLLQYITKFTNNADFSQDVLQNTFIKTHKYIHKFDINKKFSSWIYKIAYNETMTYLNKEKKNKNILSLDNNGKIEHNSFNQKDLEALSVNFWLENEMTNDIQASIKKLPIKYQKIIQMKFTQGLSYQEMSEILKLPINTIGTQLRRAKKQLIDIISKQI